MKVKKVAVVLSIIILSVNNYFAQSGQLTLVRNNNKYGFENSKGKIKIGYKYTYAEPFSEELAVVENNLNFYYINKKGKTVFNSTFYDAGDFSEGLAYVSDGKKYGYINKNGQLAISMQYDYAESFYDGVAKVWKFNPDTNLFGNFPYVYGFIDKKGELLSGSYYNRLYKVFGKDSFIVELKDSEFVFTQNGKRFFNRKIELNMDSIKKHMKVLDKKPEFPGGEQVFLKCIASSVNYPISAKNNNIQGKVFIGFDICKTGEIVNVKVIKPVHPLLNKEAKRVVMSLPDWEPGFYEGKPVIVSYQVPINFRLH